MARAHRHRQVIGGLVLILVLVACGRRAAPPPPAPPPVAGPYRVQPGDVVEVKFLYHPDDDERLTVRPDGWLPLSVTGDLNVNGLTAEELQELIRVRSSRYLRDPEVNVTITETAARAYIGGEVANPGFVSLGKPLTVLQAVLERGGFTSGADLTELRVISHASGQPVMRRLDLEEGDDAAPLEGAMLSADDIVVVPKTGIAKANAWVEAYIDGLTPQIFKSVRLPTIPTGGRSGR